MLQKTDFFCENGKELQGFVKVGNFLIYKDAPFLKDVCVSMFSWQDAGMYSSEL